MLARTPVYIGTYVCNRRSAQVFQRHEHLASFVYRVVGQKNYDALIIAAIYKY
jgi:hypothetical protein